MVPSSPVVRFLRLYSAGNPVYSSVDVLSSHHSFSGVAGCCLLIDDGAKKGLNAYTSFLTGVYRYWDCVSPFYATQKIEE